MVSIVKKETAIIPYSGQVFEEGDRIILAVDSVGIEKISELLRG